MLTSRKQEINWINVWTLLFNYLHINPLAKPSTVQKYFLNTFWENIDAKLVTDAKYDVASNRRKTQNSCAQEFESVDDWAQIDETDKELKINYYWEEIHTLDQLISHCKVDTNIRDVKDYRIKKDEVILKNRYESKIVPKFSVSASFVKKVTSKDESSINNLLDRLSERVLFSKHISNKKWLLLEVNLFDLHIDKLAFQKTDSIEDKISACLSDMISRIRWMNIERIVLPIGNDMFNNEWTWETTWWTPQDSTMKRYSAFDYGIKLMTEIVDTLIDIAPVDILIIPWNHDSNWDYYLWKVLSAYYRNDENVSVDDRKESRKYYEYGDVMIWYTHWDKEKPSDLPMIMVQETWVCKKYKVWHLGHLHIWKKFQTLTYADHLWTEIEHLRSLTWTDEWHYSKWYVCWIQSMSAFIWDREKWKQYHIHCNY